MAVIIDNSPATATQGLDEPRQMATVPGAHAMAASVSSPPVQNVQSGEILAPRRRRRLLMPILLIGAIGYGTYLFSDYYSVGRFIVSTDDAYIKADMAIIASKIPGYLVTVPVAENAFVHAGDILATIDPGDYALAVEAASGKIATQESTIDRIGRQALAQGALIDQAKAQLLSVEAQLAAARADNIRAMAEFDRATKLVQGNFATQQRLDLALADKDRTLATIASAEAAATAARAAIAAARANQQVTGAQKAEAEKARDELAIALEKARRDLSFTSIRAPFDGVVGNRAAQPGQYIQPGTRLLALVPLASVYVEANFKETQLGSLKPGQKVDLTVDSVADRKFEGVVESIAPASGSQFSLLPPENATGNFTKIVQRVPVHIRVPLDIAQAGLLRPGLSVVAKVHSRDEETPVPTLMGALGWTHANP